MKFDEDDPRLSASPLYRWLIQPSDLGSLGDRKSRFCWALHY